MNILFVCNRAPYPPDKGERIRSFYLVKHLSKKNKLFLYSTNDAGSNERSATELKKYCASVNIYPINRLLSYARMLLAMATGRSLTLAYFYSVRMKKDINNLLKKEKIELIFAYCSSSAQYAVEDVSAGRVVDFVDIDSAKWKAYSAVSAFPVSLLYAMEARRLQGWEKMVAASFDLSVVTTDKEREKLELLEPGAKGKTTVLYNGVDVERFKPSLKRPDGHGLVFTGQMDYRPNVDAMAYFCREIFPRIKKVVPDVTLTIVGRDPTVALKRRCGNAIVTGTVESVMDYLARASVYVAPLRLSFGVPNKVLEAMAAGVPVVATSAVLAGIKAEPGKDLMIGDLPQEMACIVIELLRNESMRAALAERARAFVENNHDWTKNFRSLDAALEIFC